MPGGSMEVHKPRAVHGWRELASEIGVIVVGVLIALAAEQVVQSLEWSHKIKLAEEAMAFEIGDDNAPEIYSRAMLHPCLTAKLDQIRGTVEAHRPREEVVKLTDSYQLQFLSFDSLAHDAANASGVTLHMPLKALQKWTDLYSMMPFMDRTNAREAQDIAHLKALSRTGGPLSDQERDRVLDAVETLRYDERQMISAASFSLAKIKAAGIEPGVPRMTRFTTWAKNHYGDCPKPLPADWVIPSE